MAKNDKDTGEKLAAPPDFDGPTSNGTAQSVDLQYHVIN